MMCVIRSRAVRACHFSVMMLVIGVLLPVPLSAQTTSGVIQGTVVDEQGGVLPGATLTLRNTESGATRSTVTDTEGRYRFAALPPAGYELTAELSGFETVVTRGLALTIGQESQRNLSMRVQTIAETISVVAESPLIETSRAEVAAVVTQEQIATLPIESRQPVALALLLPGTSTDTQRPRQFSADIGAGLSHYSTVYVVDGVMAWNSIAGAPQLAYPQAAIREFKVNISQAGADVGGTTGGLVTIVTKSGANRISGEVFEFFRDKRLNALDKFQQERHDLFGEPKPEFRRHQYGGAIGGPLVPDRAHFFAAMERTWQRRYFNVSTGKPQFYSSLEGAFPTDFTQSILFVRGDVKLTDQQNAFVRYNYDGPKTGCETCGGTNAAFSGTAIYQPRDSLVGAHTWVLGARAVNEARFQTSPTGGVFRSVPPGAEFWSRPGEFPPERFAGMTAAYNFPSLSWGGFSSTNQRTAQGEFRNDFLVNVGTHTMKAGGAYITLPTTEDVTGNLLGSWTFGTDQPFDGTDATISHLTNPIQFTASFPPLTRYMPNKWVQAFVQDEWRPSSHLTVSLGLRYDNQLDGFNQQLEQSMFPRPLPFVDFAARGDNNNVSPRLGVTWNLNDGRSVARAGYGRYYQLVLQGGMRGEIVNLRQVSINIRNPTYPDPYGGRAPLDFASTAPPNINIVNNDLRNPSSDTTTVGFSQELPANIALHVDGVYTKTRDMTATANINAPDLVTGVRPLPEWGNIIELQSRLGAEYRALYLRLEKRMSSWYQYQVSYTLAKNDTDVGPGASSSAVTDLRQPRLDWGPARSDRRHALVMSGSAMLPADVTLGAVWTVRSTMPFSALAGSDLNRDGSVSDYVPGTSSNMGNRGDNGTFLSLVNAWRAQNGRAPIPASQLDTNEQNVLNIRASRTFRLAGGTRLDLVAQVFNVLGTDNLLPAGSGWVTNALSDSFGRILQAQNRQQGELSVRFAW